MKAFEWITKCNTLFGKMITFNPYHISHKFNEFNQKYIDL